MQITTHMSELSAGIRDPRISNVLRLWQECQKSRFVRPGDLDLNAIPSSLPLLYVIGVPPLKQLTPDRIRYQFVGQDVARSLGIDATGMTVAEVLTRPSAASFTSAIGGLLRDPCVLHSIHVDHLPNITEMRTERLILPISDSKEVVEGFCVAFSKMERSPLNRLHEKSDAQEAWTETLRKLRL
jgi:hypothetical protein